LRQFRVMPILKPGGQKVKKIYFTIIYNFYNFSRTPSYTKS
jgi:hypothetical protein